jgi:hypothetical protein
VKRQGDRQEYIDVLSFIDSPYRISSASTTYMHTCLLRATFRTLRIDQGTPCDRPLVPPEHYGEDTVKCES